jgi:hypothetical protein
MCLWCGEPADDVASNVCDQAVVEPSGASCSIFCASRRQVWAICNSMALSTGFSALWANRTHRAAYSLYSSARAISEPAPILIRVSQRDDQFLVPHAIDCRLRTSVAAVMKATGSCHVSRECVPRTAHQRSGPSDAARSARGCQRCVRGLNERSGDRSWWPAQS